MKRCLSVVLYLIFSAAAYSYGITDKNRQANALLEEMRASYKIYEDSADILLKSKDLDKQKYEIIISSAINGINNKYTQIIEIDPLCAEAYIIQAKANMSSQTIGKAVSVLNEATNKGIENYDVYILKAKIYNNFFPLPLPVFYELALENAQKALSINPDDYEANRQITLAYMKAQNRDKAFENLNKTIDKFPNHCQDYYDRAYMYANIDKFKDYNKALSDINKAISLSKTQVFNYYMLRHRINDALKNYDAVIDDFNAMQKLDKTPNAALFNKALYLASLDRNEEAIRAYTEFINLEPNNEKAYVNRAISYRKAGKLPEAIDDYNKTIELNPKDPYVYSNLGYAYSLQGKYEEALKCYEKGKKITPQSYNYLNEITTYIKMSDFKNALASLKRYYERGKAEAKKTGKPQSILKRIYDEWQQTLTQYPEDKNAVNIQKELTKFAIADASQNNK
ncbi:MAG: tetratricopeptide repeat protein [Endomicrobium sp.]|jgi:tetratricopeptide (TPR) repeat protein|nr:tetratricopeptide repeat protein [Endomicrobium sp.]